MTCPSASSKIAENHRTSCYCHHLLFTSAMLQHDAIALNHRGVIFLWIPGQKRFAETFVPLRVNLLQYCIVQAFIRHIFCVSIEDAFNRSKTVLASHQLCSFFSSVLYTSHIPVVECGTVRSDACHTVLDFREITS